MPFNHLILCCPLLLLPSIFPRIRVLSSESVLHIRWPRCWSLSFSISPFNEHSGLISSRSDWFDLLACQGTLKSLLQHHSSKPSILHCSGFFIIQLSHPYMATGKAIAFIIQTFVTKCNRLISWSFYRILLSKHFTNIDLILTTSCLIGTFVITQFTCEKLKAWK